MKTQEHNQLLELRRLIKVMREISVEREESTEQKSSFLSTVTLTLAACILAEHSCLGNLDNRFSSRSIASLSSEDILLLTNCLYQKLESVTPDEIRKLLPRPIELRPTQLSALKVFLNNKSNFSLSRTETLLGNAYQLCSQMKRKDALKKVQTSNKEISADDLISFTQLYTPEWVVETLIASVIPEKISAEFNVIDPACGGGNFLLPAFEVLLERLCASGVSESEAVTRLAAGGLSGVDIDAIGIWITSLSLLVRCLRLNKPLSIAFKGIRLLPKENLLGTLDRTFSEQLDYPLSNKFSAVLTNPPYIGRKLLSRELKTLIRNHYPNECHDVSVAFTRRSLELLKPNGRLGVITQSSILYLPSSKEFRKTLIDEFHPLLVIEAGTGVFPLQTGEKIDSVIMTIEPRNSEAINEKTLFINLRKKQDKKESLHAALDNPEQSNNAFEREISSFRQFPNLQFNYSCPLAATKLLKSLPTIGDNTDVRQGLATTDNERFLRYAWDVPSQEINRVWFPYVKGAGSKRWWSPVLNVVNWQNDGFEIKEAVKCAYPYLNGKVHWVVKNEKFYFKEGLSFSFVNNSNFAVRVLPEGCIFDVAASALFPANIDRLALLAFLNSKFASKMAHLINPTINFQVGDVKRLPIPTFTEEEIQKLVSLANKCINATKELALSKDFHILKMLPAQIEKPSCSSETHGEPDKAYAQHCVNVEKNVDALAESEREIDTLVLASIKRLNLLADKDLTEMQIWMDSRNISEVQNQNTPLSSKEFAERWMCNKILQKVCDDGARLTIDTTAAATTSATAASEKVNCRKSVAQQINLSANAVDWLEIQLESSLQTWMHEKFQEFQRRQFFSASPLSIDETSTAAKIIRRKEPSLAGRI